MELKKVGVILWWGFLSVFLRNNFYVSWFQERSSPTVIDLHIALPCKVGQSLLQRCNGISPLFNRKHYNGNILFFWFHIPMAQLANIFFPRFARIPTYLQLIWRGSCTVTQEVGFMKNLAYNGLNNTLSLSNLMIPFRSLYSFPLWHVQM